VKPFVATFLFVIGSVVLFFLFLLAHMNLPVPRQPEIVEIRVEPGESFSAVVRKLGEHKIIVNEKLFLLWARLAGLERKIHWGLYRFELPLPPGEILNRMVLGKGLFHKITIPEGLTIKEIAELLASGDIIDRERFLIEAANPEILASLGLDGKGIEGYLLPNTYYWTPQIPEKDIIMTMAEQFQKVFYPLMEGQSHRMRMTPHEIITLASIIEKEVGVESERPLVSAVFHNRLKLKMPLQSDPTVIYGLKQFTGNLTRKHLQTPSPYNTYWIPGLPPGPICNPGLSSLKAALNPARVPYLYFVSKNDGSHLFSETLEAHNRAVKLYQGGGLDSAKR
jgi:UPF0755 protein